MTLSDRIRRAALGLSALSDADWAVVRSFIQNAEWPAASHESPMVSRFFLLFVAEALK